MPNEKFDAVTKVDTILTKVWKHPTTQIINKLEKIFRLIGGLIDDILAIKLDHRG